MRFRRREPTVSRAGPRRGGDLGFEATLWQTADKLRSNMDAAEYKHVVLGLIFLKYISDAFDQLPKDQPRADPAACRAARVFWVPEAARWQRLTDSTALGKTIDDAMVALAAHNPDLEGVLPPDLPAPRPRRPAPRRARQALIDRVGLADQQDRDILGRVYEYFLTRFASAEGKNGGQFYTPRSVVRLLVAMLAPTPGSSVYDPACGSGGMFVQSERFLVEHGGKHGDLKLYGQESNPTTWRLARMNLAIRGIVGDLGRGARRQLPPRPARRPARRLRARQPAVQHQGLGRRPPAGRPALALRRPAGPERQLRVGPAHRPPPRAPAASPGSCWPTER
jgi:type I restriction enzyme M protein